MRVDSKSRFSICHFLFLICHWNAAVTRAVFRVQTSVGFLSTKSPTEVGTLNAHFATSLVMLW